jgi:hypothetical protein
LEVGSVPTAFSVWSRARDDQPEQSPIAQANPTKWIATPSARGTWRAFSQSTPGRIADDDHRSRSRATGHSGARSPAPAIGDGDEGRDKDLRATSFIAEVFSTRRLGNGLLPLHEHLFAR